jgi:putative transposase
MVLNKLGKIADMCWREISMHHENVTIDSYIIIPNHVHGIILITDSGDPETETVATLHATSLRRNQLSETEYFSAISPKKGSLSAIILSYKAAVTKKTHADLNPRFDWQSRFYDHILRNESDLEDIRLFIELIIKNLGKGALFTQEEEPIYA